MSADQIAVTKQRADWLVGQLMLLVESWEFSPSAEKAAKSLVKGVVRQVLDFPEPVRNKTPAEMRDIYKGFEEEGR